VWGWAIDPTTEAGGLSPPPATWGARQCPYGSVTPALVAPCRGPAHPAACRRPCGVLQSQPAVDAPQRTGRNTGASSPPSPHPRHAGADADTVSNPAGPPVRRAGPAGTLPNRRPPRSGVRSAGPAARWRLDHGLAAGGGPALAS